MGTAYRRNAVNTGFLSILHRDNYRSGRIKDSVLLDDTCGNSELRLQRVGKIQNKDRRMLS